MSSSNAVFSTRLASRSFLFVGTMLVTATVLFSAAAAAQNSGSIKTVTAAVMDSSRSSVADHARITQYRRDITAADGAAVRPRTSSSNKKYSKNEAATTSAAATGAKAFSTLLTGGEGADGIVDILQLSDTIVYLLNGTYSPNLCDTARGYQPKYAGAYDAVIAAYNPKRNDLTYLSYLGGPKTDSPVLMFHVKDKLVVLMNTNSTDLPTTPDAVKRTFSGDYDLYIAVLDLSCSTLLYATYLGGSGIDIIEDARIDDNGTISMVGFTDSRSRFPITANARQKQYGGGEDDAFLTQFRIDPFRIVYSSYYGGDGYDEARTVAMSKYNAVSLAGLTSSTNLKVTPNAIQSTYIAESSGFIVVFDSLFSQTRYSTYFGGDHWGWFEGSAFSSSGLAVYCAETGTDSLPTAPSAFQRYRSGNDDPVNGNGDIYILVLDTAFQQIASTYYGGIRSEIPDYMEIYDDEIYTVGYAYGTSSPITYPTDCTDDREWNALISVLSLDCTTLKFGCLFGGDSADFIITLQQTNTGVWFGGSTYSPNFRGLGEWKGGGPKGLTQAFLVMSEGGITNVTRPPRSLNEVPDEITVSITPHSPASSRYTVTLHASRSQHAEYTIHTTAGRELLRRTADLQSGIPFTQDIDLHSSPPGLYLLSGWAAGGGTFFGKIVVWR